MIKLRESNIELLRIISMLMVFILHFMQGTGVLVSASPRSANYFLANILESLSIVAVNCFVLISGYFLIKFNFKKLFKLILQVKFYAIFLPILIVLLSGIAFTSKDILKAIAPIILKQWWFFNTYLVLYFLSPILNFIILKVNKIQFKRLLILLFILFSVLNTLYPTFNGEGGHGIYNFIFLYLIGSYIKLHVKNSIGKYKYLLIYFICSVIIVIGTFVISIITNNNSSLLYNYDSVFVIISSIALFMFFREIKIQSNLINYISKLSFGTYLIHSNTIIWSWIVANVLSKVDLNSNMLLIYMLLVSILGFVICMFIEWIRQLMMNKIENKIIDSKLINKTSIYVDDFVLIENS